MRLESCILIASEPMLIGSDRDGGDERRLCRACFAPEPSRDAVAKEMDMAVKKLALANRKGVGKLAERLIVEHPDWTYAAVAAEVNRLVEGAAATAASVRLNSISLR